ncbi:MAG TPA: hypothetical protein VN617_05390 [Rhodoferax sp.]|jgi:hypothetical protein|nr:hypothetical protein [Rhodoferax sp.]
MKIRPPGIGSDPEHPGLAQIYRSDKRLPKFNEPIGRRAQGGTHPCR